MSLQLVQKKEHLRPRDEIRAVAEVYRLLARLWISEIDLPLLQRLDLLEVAHSFFQDHLQWIIRYCHVAQTRVASRFYQAIFRMTEEFLQQESTSRVT